MIGRVLILKSLLICRNETILRQYQAYTQMPDSRIEKQVAGLKWRIANLQSYSQ